MRLEELILSRKEKRTKFGLSDILIFSISVYGGLREFLTFDMGWVGRWSWFTYCYGIGRSALGPFQDVLSMFGIGGAVYLIQRTIGNNNFGLLLRFGPAIAIIWLTFFYTLGFVLIKIGVAEAMNEISARRTNRPIRTIEDNTEKILKILKS